MQVKYRHYLSGEVCVVSVRKFYGLRLWKRWVKGVADSHGQYMLVRKDVPIRVAYAYRMVGADGPILNPVERSVKSHHWFF
jgi:hypothetical protein